MKHVTELLQLFVSGDLDGSQRDVVEEHLKNCPPCRAAADEVRGMWEELGSVGPSPSNQSVWPAVQARTFGAESVNREWFFGSGRLVRGALATMALAAGLALGVLVPANEGWDGNAADPGTASSFLSESSWLSDSSWLGGEGASGIDEFLLGAELPNEVNGS